MMGFADIQADDEFSLFAIAWIRRSVPQDEIEVLSSLYLLNNGRYNPALGPLVGGPVVKERKMMPVMLADVGEMML